MIGSEFVDQLPSGSYNLSTSPYTVSNMQGDLYNYHFIIFCDSGSATNGTLDITLNSDTGTNYNRYHMLGVTSTASAFTATGEPNIILPRFTQSASSRNSLAMGSLTGSSGSSRKVDLFFSDGDGPRVRKQDAYWTNTVDEVTSMTFTGSVSASYTWHIMVYRTPKASVQGTWEYMKELNWSSETAEKSFTVDGDKDIQYMIAWDGDVEIGIQCNNDGGSNYVRQQLRNAGGSIAAVNQTTNTAIAPDGTRNITIINAESGVDRLSYSTCSDTTTSQQNQIAVWWQNTGDNITSLEVSATSATGTAKLYRRINPYVTADVFPFETIKTFTVSGDYSAGDTLSGLTCDDYKMIKIEGLFSTVGNDLRLQLNSDTGSNYTVQYVKGVSSTASAASSTTTFQLLCDASASKQAYFEYYIYPKSGEYRPTLLKVMHGEDSIEFKAFWWLNSADEITAIKTYASSTTTCTGEIKISVLR